MYYILVAGGYRAPVMVPGFYSFYMLALAKLMPYESVRLSSSSAKSRGGAGASKGAELPYFQWVTDPVAGTEGPGSQPRCTCRTAM